MKNFLLLFAVLLSISGYSQDIIITKTGEEINGKILEVGTEEIKYKKSDDSPLYVLKKNDVFMIKYANGNKDIFNDQFKNESAASNTADTIENRMYRKGLNDGSITYDGMNSGKTGVLATTILATPLLGLIPAIACSSSPPKEANLHFPNAALTTNANYMRGYKESAFKIKKHLIWRAYAIGLVADLLIGIIIISPHSSH